QLSTRSPRSAIDTGTAGDGWQPPSPAGVNGWSAVRLELVDPGGAAGTAVLLCLQDVDADEPPDGVHRAGGDVGGVTPYLRHRGAVGEDRAGDPGLGLARTVDAQRLDVEVARRRLRRVDGDGLPVRQVDEYLGEDRGVDGDVGGAQVLRVDAHRRPDVLCAHR